MRREHNSKVESKENLRTWFRVGGVIWLETFPHVCINTTNDEGIMMEYYETRDDAYIDMTFDEFYKMCAVQSLEFYGFPKNKIDEYINW